MGPERFMANPLIPAQYTLISTYFNEEGNHAERIAEQGGTKKRSAFEGQSFKALRAGWSAYSGAGGEPSRADAQADGCGLGVTDAEIVTLQAAFR